jgi:putative protein kinase ArgK-like GTPase of G3E family
MNLKLNGEVARMSQQVSLDETVAMLRDRIQNLLTKQACADPRCRVLIALAGVPGSGKSTVSDALLRALPDHGNNEVAVLPMVRRQCHHVSSSIRS